MAVDREARDALANAIVARMKAEVTTHQFTLRAEFIAGRSMDKSLRTVSDEIARLRGDEDDRPLAVKEDDWHYMRRLVGFLKTGFDLVGVRRRVWHATQLYAFFGLVLLGVFFRREQLLHLGIAWVALATGLLVFSRALTFPVHPEIARLRAFAPFWSDSEWRAVEPLLEPLALPLYAAPDPASPVPAKAGSWRRSMDSICAPYVLLPFILFFLMLGSVNSVPMVRR